MNFTRNNDTILTSSDKKSNENISTSSLILSEENDSSNINGSINHKLQKSDSSSENNDIPISLPTDKLSSVQQLKNVVHTWQKKNIDTLKENLDEYCSDVLERANLITPLDKLNQDYASADKDMENLLSALKETDEIHKKFSKVSISSPVHDYTELYQKKDKNANIVKKINFEDCEDNELNVSTLQPKKYLESIDSEADFEGNPTQNHEITYSEGNENVQSLLNYDESTTTKMYEHFETNGESTFELNYTTLSRDSKTNQSNSFSIDEINMIKSIRKKNVEGNIPDSHQKYNPDNDSSSDLDDLNISQKSHRSYKSEVGNEDKEKLLAKLKAIDNGENIEFTSIKKNKNDFIKELFG